MKLRILPFFSAMVGLQAAPCRLTMEGWAKSEVLATASAKLGAQDYGNRSVHLVHDGSFAPEEYAISPASGVITVRVATPRGALYAAYALMRRIPDQPLRTKPYFPIREWPDMVIGNEDGYLLYVENTSPERLPQSLALAVELRAGGETFRIQTPKALQGPAEGRWGYTSPVLVDWDDDGDLDTITGSMYEHFLYLENRGTAKKFELQNRELSPIQVVSLWRRCGEPGR